VTTLIHRFEAWVERTPEAEAVVFGAERLTYAELDRRASRLACHLRDLGVVPGALVGVCLERSAELVVALLGVLKADGAYLPLDPAYPAERLRWMLADSGARVTIARGTLDGVGELAGHAFVRLDRDAEAVAAQCAAPCQRQGSADEIAYVMYTSGSTGLPKGVAIPQRGIVRLVVGTDYLALQPGDRVLQASTPSFDASTFEIWGALLNGACLVGLPRDVCLSPRDLAAALRQEGITALLLTTALFHQVAREVPDAFRSVRDVFFGGEAADPHLLREVLVHGAPGRLVNLYGPTECTVVATWHLVQTVAEGAVSVPIGRPIAGTDVHIVDAELRPVPAGQGGELLVGGDRLARGYWNRPDVTAERFVPNPFADVSAAGSRLYRTGDLVCRRPEGTLDFLGRVDQQVKIRGFRIEPGEVEAVLSAHPAVRQAHLEVRRDAGGEKRLVAYAVAAETERAELRRFLTARLPPHMVPSAIVLLDTLPLTPNGKLDRDALPEPDRESAGLAHEHVPLQTLLEERLAALWRDLLGVAQPGAHDDFFALGGHSLLAGRLVSRVRAELGVELPLRDIYDHPTLAGLAERVAAAGKAELPPIERAARDQPLPLSFPQERVWFLNELSPGNTAYNSQATIRFRGPLDPRVLEAALTEIVRRHEIFRTRFPTVDGTPVQEPLPPFPIRLPVVDLHGLPAGRIEDEAEALIRRDLQRPFDLLKVPLARWFLILHGPMDQTLVQVEHHFVHDGWSFARLLFEIRELYRAFAAGQPSPLPEPPIQYADFAVWQRRWMQGEVLRRHVEHWTGVLAGCPPHLDLPADRSRPPAQSFRGAALRIGLDPALGRRLRAFARQRGATLYTTMLAGFALLMHRLAGQDDLVVGTAAANRRLGELEPMIGMVVNTLPLRFGFTGEPGFAELVARVQEVALQAYAWQDVPLERVVEALAPVRDPSRNPLFQVMFSFHDSPVPDLELCGLRGELLERHNGSAKNDLNIIGIPRAEQRVGRERRDDDDVITLIWEYATDLFDTATMRRMAGHYQRLLGAALDEPEGRAAELPLLAEAELHQLRVEWNETAAATPWPGRAHELFEEQAAARPSALAVAAGGGRLSYAELDARSNRLAHRLIRLGVGPEVPVALLLHRSPEMVAGALGVLKAGGAYLPLDPAYPPERIAFMVADAGVLVILTTENQLERLPEGLADRGLQVVLLDPAWQGLAQESAARPPCRGDGDGTAYVIYTSGSTGRPKGVQVSHANLMHLVAWHRSVYGVTPEDRATQVAGPAFDASVWEVWPYLTAGASLHIPDEETRETPPRLMAWLVREGITLAFLPTPLAEAVLEEPWPGTAPLRALLTGGDRLRRRPRPDLPFAVYNHYGPTEGTVVATAGRTAGRRDSAPSIGRPIANARACLLDRQGQPVPIGMPGELCVGGRGLARGYCGRPGLTAERFVPDAVSGEAGGRLYRTGDLVRWRADGRLEFLGRIDHQVKLRGFRIELGEIEAVLAEHAAVREAVALVREDAPGDRRLVAYVVSDGGVAAGELAEHCQRKLPRYMVPWAFVPLAALPLSPNGKLDRAALPPPEGAAVESYVPPSGPVEEVVAGLFARSLGVERVGANDGFFSLGGHSLLATRLLFQIGQAFRMEVPLHAFFDQPTVAGVARALTGREARPGQCEAAARLLQRLDKMSPDEVAAMLRQKRAGREEERTA